MRVAVFLLALVVAAEAGFWKKVGNGLKNAGQAVADTVAAPIVNTLNDWLPIEIPPTQCWTDTCGMSSSQAQKRADNSQLKNWMSRIPDNTMLNQLTIPATHDSGAIKAGTIDSAGGAVKSITKAFGGGAGAAYIQCREGTIAQQLRWGIRALDIRGRHKGNNLHIVHGAANMGYTFGHVMNQVRDFLQAYATETILIRLKPEAEESGNSRAYHQTVSAILANYASYQHKWRGVPKLGDARGKFIILRGYNPSAGGELVWHPNYLSIQDSWQPQSTDSKWNHVKAKLDEAHSSSSSKLFVNFASLSPDHRASIPSNAKSLNKKLGDYFGQARGSKFGLINMDYPPQNLLERLVNNGNSDLL